MESIDASQCYSPQMTESEKERSLQMLDAFHRLSEKHHLDYAMCWGTALGHERHGGFIPWDDDIDLCVPEEQSDRLQQVLADMPSWTGYARHPGDEDFPHGFDKVFDREGVDTGYDWRWPFVDIFEVPSSNPHHRHLFPSRPLEHPFEGRLTLRQPRRPDAHLARQYGERYMEQLMDGGWSHRLEELARECEPVEVPTLPSAQDERSGCVISGHAE